MSADTVYELIGYLGSALIVVSLAMSSIIRLRIVNLAGAVVFSFYGVLIGSIPVIVTNVIISGLDIWYLRKELTTRPALTVVPVDAADSVDPEVPTGVLPGAPSSPQPTPRPRHSMRARVSHICMPRV